MKKDKEIRELFNPDSLLTHEMKKRLAEIKDERKWAKRLLETPGMRTDVVRVSKKKKLTK